MTDNVIEFRKPRSKDDVVEEHRYVADLTLFVDETSGHMWATVPQADAENMNADWHRMLATHLRQVAWLADVMAAEADGTKEPIASVNLFEDSLISTRWNGELVVNDGHIQWIRDQLQCGADEIAAALQEGE